ncbi:ATP adenylyltransferase family protein [Rubidibacter lacunae]|nr:hypothetical protein [Rubidibacter lacunae]
MTETNPPSPTLLHHPDTLWETVRQRQVSAKASGALQSLPTTTAIVEQDGIEFVVRVLAAIARKERATQVQRQSRADSKPFDPFLPYERDLFVMDISATHVCLLNKFNVVDGHLLIVTRAYEEQASWLSDRDWEATRACLAEAPGLAFYNSGPVAGASQQHKHLQVVPLPLGPGGADLPIAGAIAAAVPAGSSEAIARSPLLPFAHSLAFLPAGATVATMQARYRQAIAAIDGEREAAMPPPHNLLLTRDWLMVVPRTHAEYQGIPVNALGFAGTLFARNRAQFELLRTLGPRSVLQAVSRPLQAVD